MTDEPRPDIFEIYSVFASGTHWVGAQEEIANFRKDTHKRVRNVYNSFSIRESASQNKIRDMEEQGSLRYHALRAKMCTKDAKIADLEKEISAKDAKIFAYERKITRMSE